MFDPEKYYITYRIDHHPEGLTRDELVALGDGIGACHAMLAASILFPKDGSYSTLFMSRDGRLPEGNDLSDAEWFKVWMMLTIRLSRSETVSPERREMLKLIVETIRFVVFAQREKG